MSRPAGAKAKRSVGVILERLPLDGDNVQRGRLVGGLSLRLGMLANLSWWLRRI